MTNGKIESSLGANGDAADAEPPAGRTVGPGKPPLDYRFQKGRSGNPAGRPRRTGAPGDRLRGADEPTREVILAEAYRTVTVRDGDSEIEMPMNQAVFRAIGLAALGGCQSAQRRWAAMVQAAEAKQMRAQLAIFNVMEREGKERAARLRERSDKEVSYDPYAEDIIVDSRSGAVVIRGGGEGDEV